MRILEEKKTICISYFLIFNEMKLFNYCSVDKQLLFTN